MFKVLISLIILGIAAIPVTAALSAASQQIKVTPNPFDFPATMDTNGMITKINTIFVTNYGFYDINSILMVTNVLNESLYSYGAPTINLWYVPHGSMVPMFIVTRVNLTALNVSGTIGDFLNSSSFLSQNILDVRYAYGLAGFSTMLITPLGALSPMGNLSNGLANRDDVDNTKADIPIGFLNFIQGYNFHIDVTLSKGAVVATGSDDYSASSATFLLPALFLDSITVTSVGEILIDTGYTLTITVTSPFGYTFTNTSVDVVA